MVNINDDIEKNSVEHYEVAKARQQVAKRHANCKNNYVPFSMLLDGV